MRAKEHIREHGLEDRISARLGDGLEKLEPGEADAVVIAGMGGELVIRILEGGKRLWEDVRDWILSPQSELEKVRRFLWENGFETAAEAMVEEDGKYYTVMKCRRRKESVPRGGIPPVSGRVQIRKNPFKTGRSGAEGISGAGDRAAPRHRGAAEIFRHPEGRRTAERSGTGVKNGRGGIR